MLPSIAATPCRRILRCSGWPFASGNTATRAYFPVSGDRLSAIGMSDLVDDGSRCARGSSCRRSRSRRSCCRSRQLTTIVGGGAGEGRAIHSVQQGKNKQCTKDGNCGTSISRKDQPNAGPRRTSEPRLRALPARSTGRRAVAAGRAGDPFPRASASPLKTAVTAKPSKAVGPGR